MYHVSIITVNYNSSEDTIKMVESINKNTSINHEIIVLDNNSRFDEYEKLLPLKAIDNVKVVRSVLNLGFSGGNMLGVKEADIHSKYFFFLNNDTVLLNNTIDILYDSCETNPEIGLITSQQYSESNELISSFKYFPSVSESLLGKGFANFVSKKRRYSSKVEHKDIIEVGVVSGAAMFISRSCFEKVGGLDDGFFLYCEEEDISKRVWDKGYTVCFQPKAKIVHFCGKSTERNFEIERESIISYFRLLDKHLDIFRRSILKALLLLKYLKKIKKSQKNRKIVKFILSSEKNKYSLKYIQKESER